MIFEPDTSSNSRVRGTLFALSVTEIMESSKSILKDFNKKQQLYTNYKQALS